MTKEMKRNLNKYYHNIGKALVCGGRKRRSIIVNIKDSVACYLSEHPDASMDDIYANFGSEKEVADEYYNNESPETIKKSIKLNRRAERNSALVYHIKYGFDEFGEADISLDLIATFSQLFCEFCI